MANKLIWEYETEFIRPPRLSLINIRNYYNIIRNLNMQNPLPSSYQRVNRYLSLIIIMIIIIASELDTGSNTFKWDSSVELGTLNMEIVFISFSDTNPSDLPKWHSNPLAVLHPDVYLSIYQCPMNRNCLSYSSSVTSFLSVSQDKLIN